MFPISFYHTTLHPVTCAGNLKVIFDTLFSTLDKWIFKYCASVQFSHSVMSHSLRPHELQHARPPCPLPTPRVYPNSCPLSQWCHLTISSSVVPFSSCLLLLLLSHFSRVRLCVTPWTAASQASPSMGFSRQQYWSGVPLPSPPPAFSLSQNQSLFKWVSSSHQVAKILEFQLQHQSFQWTPRTDFL